MKFYERPDKIARTVECPLTLQQSHDDQSGGLTGRMDTLAQRMDMLTERTLQAMDAINRLAYTAG